MSGLYRYPSQPNMYRGEYFDSALERRWAIVLDALDIPFRRARLVVKTNTGRATKDNWVANPDFYLPRRELFFEIKPTAEILWAGEFKWKAVAKESGIPILVVAGSPHDRDRESWVWLPNGEDAPAYWGRCPNCRAVAIAAIDFPSVWDGPVDEDLLKATIEELERSARGLPPLRTDIWMLMDDPDAPQEVRPITDEPVPTIHWWSECLCLSSFSGWTWDDVGWMTMGPPWEEQQRLL